MTPLYDLMGDLPYGLLPAENPDVQGISNDSRTIAPGDLYVAIVGERFDGREFAAQAADRGAVAAIGPGPAPDVGLPWVEVEDPRPLLGTLSSRIYGSPQERLRLVGVTGTNGKTSIVHLTANVLEAEGVPCGVGGTLGYCFDGRHYLPGNQRTTPEAPDLFRVLAEMVSAGARGAALEISSHALAMGRVKTLGFDVAAFTNLTRDHLDFHGTMEEYFRAKELLFDQLKTGGRAVVALADDYGRRLAEKLRQRFGDRLLTCALDGEADVRLTSSRLDFRGLELELRMPSGRLSLRTRLIGRYNAWNTVITAAIGEALEVSPEAIAEGILRTATVDGRLDPVDYGQPFPVYVDYAHTPGALEATLESLRELSERQLIVVFGCGGNRDQGKRPQMGRIVGEYADLPIATSDNPRDEDPQAILDAVAEGLEESGHRDYRLILDRREAIGAAVAVAAAAPDDWAVLVAGKGHEDYQIVGDRTLPFSDREELAAFLAGHGYDPLKDSKTTSAFYPIRGDLD